MPPPSHLPDDAYLRKIGLVVYKVGLELVRYAPQCSRREVEVYLGAGGNALLEVTPQRNALLHARPATDEHGPSGLFQRRMREAHLVNDTWLERLIQRIEDLQVELDALRPSFIT